MNKQEINDELKILYLCDKKACDKCCIDDKCKHTTNIENAKNFNRLFHDCYAEKEILSVNEYQKKSLETCNESLTAKDLLIEGLMGINGEAGECIDILKKVIFQNHIFDKEKMIEELGDVAWYLSLSAYSIGCDLEHVFITNLEKLKKRYPDGFSSENSISRDDTITAEKEGE